MADLNFVKLPSDKHITVAVGPSGGTTLGITEIDEPLAAELNNTGGTSGMIPASQSRLDLLPKSSGSPVKSKCVGTTSGREG